MTEVKLNELFSGAADVASKYFVEAAWNANVLKRNKNDFHVIDTSHLIRPFASRQIELKSPLFLGSLDLKSQFSPIQRDILLQWIDENMQSKLFFILLGCVSGVNEFQPTFARDCFELHTSIQNMNGCVRGVQQGNLELRKTLEALTDIVMLQSKLLQQSLIHAAATANDELSVAFLKRLLNLQVGPALDAKMSQAAQDRHTKRVSVYSLRLDEAA